MEKVTLNPQNIHRPAPYWWRRLERAMLIVFIPAAVAIVQGFEFEDEKMALRITLLINVGLVALIKGFGELMGDGEEYVTTKQKQQIDEQT